MKLSIFIGSKSPDTIKREFGYIEGLFEEHGAGVYIHFDRCFINLLKHDDTSIVKMAFNNLLEIVRLRPSRMSDYYDMMVSVLSSCGITNSFR